MDMCLTTVSLLALGMATLTLIRGTSYLLVGGLLLTGHLAPLSAGLSALIMVGSIAGPWIVLAGIFFLWYRLAGWGPSIPSTLLAFVPIVGILTSLFALGLTP